MTQHETETTKGLQMSQSVYLRKRASWHFGAESCHLLPELWLWVELKLQRTTNSKWLTTSAFCHLFFVSDQKSHMLEYVPGCGVWGRVGFDNPIVRNDSLLHVSPSQMVWVWRTYKHLCCISEVTPPSLHNTSRLNTSRLFFIAFQSMEDSPLVY